MGIGFASKVGGGLTVEVGSCVVGVASWVATKVGRFFGVPVAVGSMVAFVAVGFSGIGTIMVGVLVGSPTFPLTVVDP